MVRKPEFRLQSEGQKERGKLPLGKYVRLALAATETVTVSQERGSILPVKRTFFFHYMSAMESLICHFYMNGLAYIALIPMCGIKPKMEDTQQYDKN